MCIDISEKRNLRKSFTIFWFRQNEYFFNMILLAFHGFESSTLFTVKPTVYVFDQ